MVEMKNTNLLKLTLGDWQWNSAVIGFINIVGKENVNCIEDRVEFAPEILNGFEEKFFEYLIKTYEKTLSWYKIISFQDKLEAYENNNFDNFSLEALKSLNTYLKDVKRYIKSNSYKAAYELMALDVDMLVLEKNLTTVKEPINQQQFEANKNKILSEVKETLSVLNKIIDYCNTPEGRRYIRAKNIIYTVVNNAWNGVSFLNAQTKEKEVYIDYKVHFVDGAIDYLKQDKSRYKYNCFICNESIKDMSNDLSFLNATGFDVARKSSHVWNFQNDIAICPICKLVYSCLPAGLTYVYDRGIYVNANVSVNKAYEINHTIKAEILRIKESGMRSIYPILVGSLHQHEHGTAKYELADIQVVRYEGGSYRFNILSRKMLEIIAGNKDDLDSLIRAAFSENGINVRIYDEVIVRIFNNQNLFTLIHRMLYHKLANSTKCYFHGNHIYRLLKINQEIYMRLGGMKMDIGEVSKRNATLIWSARTAGETLKKKYYGKDAQHKLPGICYRLLNALKTSNKDMFMDVALNCFLYTKTQVPKVIVESLSNDKDFSTVGYAFVAALVDEPNKDSENMAHKDEKGE